MGLPSATRTVKRSRRRARKFNVKVIDLTAEQWQMILEAVDHKCAYCGQTVDKFTQDHIIPLCKGGPHSASNVLPVCERCNNLKGDMFYAQFMKKYGNKNSL